MLQGYFKSLYQSTMRQAYALALAEITASLAAGGRCLDCGAQGGETYDLICRTLPFDCGRYFGLEWNPECVRSIRRKGLAVIQGDLNHGLPFRSNSFACVCALSVLEHLVNGCRFMVECRRVLEYGGSLVLLTPNISTFFTIFQLLLGKTPSSGPHPDSNLLFESERSITVTDIQNPDLENAFSQHRHMMVFSFRLLKKYLKLAGFSSVRAFGFGLYPFPIWLQPFLEKIDPYHCHQMVMVARK